MRWGALRRLSAAAPAAPAAVRRNPAGIQMLSEDLHRQLFRGRTNEVSPAKLRESENLLRKHNLLGRAPDTSPPISFRLPPLEGDTVAAHFAAIGRRYSAPYWQLAEQLARGPLRPPPPSWRMEPGWTEYTDDAPPRPVAAPPDDALVMDTEVLMPIGPHAVLATASSPRAWYGWVSPQLLDSARGGELISIGPMDKPRLIVGHNVSFDRARIAEEYAPTRTTTRFLDTMSLHMAVAGLTGAQRGIFKRVQRAGEGLIDDAMDNLDWIRAGSPNSLIDVHNFHCGGADNGDGKALRNVFIDGTMDDVRRDFDDLMAYCANDVRLTWEILRTVLPLFARKAPHPVTFAGMLEMGTCYLPVTDGWEAYKVKAEDAYTKVSQQMKEMLRGLALAALEAHRGDHGRSDPWLRHLDWTVVEQQFTKPKLKKDGTFAKNGEPRPKRQRLPGYPEWFKALCPAGEPVPDVTLRTRVAPALLKLQWRGFPLYFHETHKWGYLVPRERVREAEGDRAPLALVDDGALAYFALPHKDGPEARCGDPLAKEYMPAIADGTLTSEYPEARAILEASSMCSYWVSCRKRVFSQFVVYEGSGGDGARPPLPGGVRGAIIPAVVAAGTITRRAVEPTWMTASNPKRRLVGSELKAQVVAPPGYRFVGADVDSQELWISALLGDAALGFHGATPLGWMTLQGKKSDGTDLHSRTASILGISRDHAKVFNYGRIYGAGEKYAARLLKQFNKTLSEGEAQQRAAELYRQTKGERARAPSVLGSTSPRRSVWKDGSESYMFNRLEEIATSADPRTPALGCAITDALHPSVVGQSYMTSRINWVVQSSGVDYLHMLLVSMNWLTDTYGIKDSRFIISIHDELRYMTPEAEATRVALALQISNLLTRAMFAERVGISDLPQSVAFFSAVDVDTVLRKEVNLDCVTPSNETPIPPGTQYDITRILSETNGGDLGAAPAAAADTAAV